MESIVAYTYPQIVWREGQKMLWNPIHRKPLKNRPEERVRLRIIEYLLSAGWSKHRISTEEAIGKLADTGMRTDVICYSQQFEPRILMECKAEYIPISAKTARQVARYNQQVAAPYLLMSNGIADFWYEVDSSGVKVLDAPPSLLGTDRPSPAYDFEGWRNRGFAGSKASPALRRWLADLLPNIWQEQEAGGIRFLMFNQALTDLNLSHYYLVQQVTERRRLALSTVATAYGGNRLIAILNEQNRNRAVMEINLDLLFDEKDKNGSIYSEAGVHTFDTAAFVDLPRTVRVPLLSEQIRDLFSEYLE